MILASQSINDSEGWEALRKEILDKIWEANRKVEQPYRNYAPSHTEPSTRRGPQQVADATATHIKGTSSSTVALSTMSSRGDRCLHSRRMKSPVEQNITP